MPRERSSSWRNDLIRIKSADRAVVAALQKNFLNENRGAEFVTNGVSADQDAGSWVEIEFSRPSAPQRDGQSRPHGTSSVAS